MIPGPEHALPVSIAGRIDLAVDEVRRLGLS
jgi:hypothetical protein